MGAAAVMANTAIATAGDVQVMAEAFKKAIEAGRSAYLSGLGRTLDKGASASSPLRDFCTTKDYQIKEKTKCHQIQQNMANILMKVSSMK